MEIHRVWKHLKTFIQSFRESTDNLKSELTTFVDCYLRFIPVLASKERIVTV